MSGFSSSSPRFFFNPDSRRKDFMLSAKVDIYRLYCGIVAPGQPARDASARGETHDITAFSAGFFSKIT
jgi:hypothetical protein